MNRARWKQIERDWALWLGGKRVPVTGRQRGSAPDVEHPLYAIEVKAGRVLSPRLRLGMAQAVASAVGTCKTPLLCVTDRVEGKRDAQHYVVLRLEDWQALTGDGPSAIGGQDD